MILIGIVGVLVVAVAGISTRAGNNQNIYFPTASDKFF